MRNAIAVQDSPCTGRGADAGTVCVSSANGTSAMTSTRTRRWPVVVALVAAWPVGVAAAEPVVNSADLLLLAVAGLFVWGWAR